eukprot:CAMPEP_0117737690 /NCGR_PEP_ID=MMETSP0947-20121206/2682_1 /TAXON_ID=44440 /ORGANISM="Chattonella subsalsa, Strain CCMP2191" /LENGTH=292 /DNA_ID=CAMNT_0005553233 /DNA_START=258 /DNA_END=1136 /DNA_ORIENTATION=+
MKPHKKDKKSNITRLGRRDLSESSGSEIMERISSPSNSKDQNIAMRSNRSNDKVLQPSSSEEELHYQAAWQSSTTRKAAFHEDYDYPDPHQERILIRRHRASVRRKVLVDEARLWARLRKMDSTKTGLLSVRYFKEAVSQHAHLTLEEMGWLVSQLRTRGGSIAYMELGNALQPKKNNYRGNIWEEDENGSSNSDESENAMRRIGLMRAEKLETDEWARRHGSLGEWLQCVASPMERKNFYSFVRMIEKFEQQHGLDPPRREGPFYDGSNEEGLVVVRLGPMLKAQINFFVS